MKNKLEQHILDSMSKNLGNWRGPFYINRKDPRLLVPKYNPMMGWTLNFANPYTYFKCNSHYFNYCRFSIVLIVLIYFHQFTTDLQYCIICGVF